MKKLRVYILAAAVSIGGLIGTTFAQEVSGEGFKAAYVDSQYLMSLHPVYEQFTALREQANAELQELNEQAQALVEKAQSGVTLTPGEEEALNLAMVSLQSVGEHYESEIQKLVEPAIDDINELIRETASELGITMVFDLYMASESGLIVYADPASDITPQIAELLSPGSGD